MLLVSAVQNLLWVFRYPSFSSDLLGPYKVGVIQRRIPGSTTSQIFYPAEAASSSSASTKDGTAYFRPKAVSGLADYTRQTEDWFQFLSNRDHPCLVNAPVEQGDEQHKKERYPIVVFSHGLGGCMEMYTDLCQQVASAGMIVVAMEHEDGSGCFAETQAGEEILYKRPDDTPYSRHKVVNFRRPFLRHRVDETVKAVEFFLGEWRNEQTMKNDPLFTQVLESTDPSKRVALFGHSFGGASMALATATIQESSSAEQTFINSLTMLDPWAFSLEDKMLQEGIPSSIPFLSILSEAWLTNPERQQVLELHATNPSKLFYMPHSRHASFSDSAWWLPRFITRRMGLRGPKEPRHETVRSSANACVQHITTAMRRYEDNSSPDVDDDDYAPLLPFPVVGQN